MVEVGACEGIMEGEEEKVCGSFFAISLPSAEGDLREKKIPRGFFFGAAVVAAWVVVGWWISTFVEDDELWSSEEESLSLSPPDHRKKKETVSSDQAGTEKEMSKEGGEDLGYWKSGWSTRHWLRGPRFARSNC